MSKTARGCGVTKGAGNAGKNLTPEGDKKSRGGYDTNTLTRRGGMGEGFPVPIGFLPQLQPHTLQRFTLSARLATPNATQLHDQ